MSTFTSTFTASNGAQSKTLAHTFTVYATSPITLSATFPTSPKVGDAVNFDVTATLANGATGTLTITQDTLPAGLSLGATSQVDANHYKATVSGTLTTAATGTTNFGATGGSVAAQELAWNWTVSAAPSGPTRVAQQMIVGTSGVSSVAFDAVDLLAGDLVVIKYGCPFSNRYINSITQSSGSNTYGDALNSDPTNHVSVQQIQYAFAAEDAAACVITPNFNGSIDTFGCALEVYRAPAGKTWTFEAAASQIVADPGQNPDDISTSAITLAGNGVIAIWCGNTRDGFICNNIAQTPGDVVAKADSLGSTVGFSGEYLFTDGLAEQVVSAGIGGNTGSGGENWTIKRLLVAPFTYA